MNIAPLIIAGLFALLGSVITLYITNYFQSKHEKELAHRDKKIELYSEILQFMLDLFPSKLPNIPAKPNPDVQVAKFREFHRKLILWANPDTIIAYDDFHKSITNPPPRAENVIKLINFFLSIRKDLGLENKGIKYNHIARFIFTNSDLLIEQYDLNTKVTFAEIVELEKKQIQDSTAPK